MFRAYSAHLQEVHFVIIYEYMRSLVLSLCKSELSKIIVLKFVTLLISENLINLIISEDLSEKF
jgi:hypothetical protein